MTRIVCIVCDAVKPYAQHLNEPSTCLECGRITGNRSVGDDVAYIAPWSRMTFAQQRELFQQERKRA